MPCAWKKFVTALKRPARAFTTNLSGAKLKVFSIVQQKKSLQSVFEHNKEPPELRNFGNGFVTNIWKMSILKLWTVYILTFPTWSWWTVEQCYCKNSLYEKIHLFDAICLRHETAIKWMRRQKYGNRYQSTNIYFLKK